MTNQLSKCCEKCFHILTFKDCPCHIPQSKEEINQCDGCQAGLPLQGNCHFSKNGHIDSYCQKSRYTPTTKEKSKCCRECGITNVLHHGGQRLCDFTCTCHAPTPDGEECNCNKFTCETCGEKECGCIEEKGFEHKAKAHRMGYESDFDRFVKEGHTDGICQACRPKLFPQPPESEWETTLHNLQLILLETDYRSETIIDNLRKIIRAELSTSRKAVLTSLIEKLEEIKVKKNTSGVTTDESDELKESLGFIDSGFNAGLGRAQQIIVATITSLNKEEHE